MRQQLERPDTTPDRVNRRFEAIIFDWDGTAVPDRAADASELRRRVEELCALGMDLAAISETDVGDIDRQLRARPRGPGSLHLLPNRGLEVFHVNELGPQLVERRVATADEDAALDAAAVLTIQRLKARGLEATLVSQRLNRRRIACGLAGLREAVELANEAAEDAGLQSARVTSDAKHVEIGLTDKLDAARWMLADLWRRGIGPRSVLIAADELGPLGALPVSDADLPALFADQLARRRDGEVPQLDGEPGWTLAIEAIHPEHERAHESLLALADGRLGTRGSPAGDHPSATPLVIAAGVYRGAGTETELQPGPLWNRLPVSIDSGRPTRRTLDLRAGLLRQELGAPDGPVETISFSSMARPGTVALRASGPAASLAGGRPLAAPAGAAAGGTRVEAGIDYRRPWMWVGGRGSGLAAAAAETRLGRGLSARLDRIAAYRASDEPSTGREAALEQLEVAREAGFERLLVEHRASWAGRWEDADVEIDGDPELQLAVRVALFHLIASVADTGEAAVGARGLSGPAYRGHVFWDSDVFMLPFLAATHPEAAKAMLEYRIRRIPAARAAARAAGRAGARFPWESAATGEDVTPTSARNRAGDQVEIRTGALEEHIVAGVAWATACYLDWTGDESFLSDGAARLLVETARYWASRIVQGGDGRAHIRGVIGPDEYHVGVDDNAFTNVMARWNLRRAAGLDPEHATGVDDRERVTWLAVADALVDGYDSETGVYEQFAGFHALEPLVIADLAPGRPIAADLLLGPARVASSQVLKQADVLMLHHLVPDEVAPDSLGANLRFYEPRTAHASSLSPGIHAALLARAGEPGAALDALRLTARIDLDDISETTAGGLHLAAMGSLWQALAFGFVGARALDGVLRLDPRLPVGWDALTLRLRFHGARVRLTVDGNEVQVSTDRPIRLAVGAQAAPIPIGPGTTRLELPAAGQEQSAR